MIKLGKKTHHKWSQFDSVPQYSIEIQNFVICFSDLSSSVSSSENSIESSRPVKRHFV